ncbi:mechanosensitive ion channel domain-containing protein [Roseofilum casamattae]|uniref:Mechanosensitive ion channel n=1 Tax=Roseofilum casamattae BLCC-M143 TaxID=3022442 RepID=A0ABT7BXX6_9CYAN|nr:mechanosensitive ion channel family protein [Roseofilum casamattae]MDJ1184052.1 mechanosensitive ion channel [Roseofilum casamattae BLCC-M143]
MPKSRRSRRSKRRLRYVVVAAMAIAFTSGVEVAPTQMKSALAQDEAVELIEELVGEATPVEAEVVDEAPAPMPISTGDPDIPVDELKLLVKPLTLGELEIEAEAWLSLLQGKVREITNQEIAIKRKNRKIEETEDAVKALEEAEKNLEAAQQAEETQGVGSEAALNQAEKAQEALEKAQESVLQANEAEQAIQEDEELKATVESTVEGDTEHGDEEVEALLDTNVDTEDAEAAQESIEDAAALLESELGSDEAAAEGDTPEDPEATAEDEAIAEGEEAPAIEATDEKIEQLEEVEAQLAEAAAAEEDVKQELVVEVTQLQTEQTATADRLKVILDAMDQRGGDTESYRQYIIAISGIEIDINDTQGLMVRLMGWARSEEGGLRWAKNVGIFVGIVAISVIIAWVGGGWLESLFLKTSFASELMENFLVMVFRRGTVTVGVLLGLTALEVSLGPLIALLGGASFVLAFALQSNLGNLASGLMLMINKPFDVGDEVKVGGMWVLVESISLANTTFRSWDNELISVPNNTVWNSNIYNLTHAPFRKVKHQLRLNVNEDLTRVKELLVEIVKSHPKVIQDKYIGTYVYWYQEDHIPITVACWATKDDFWYVWEDTLIMIQERFKQEGIKIAIPTQVEIQYEFNQGEMASLPPSLSSTAPSFAKNS